ncbi:MAG: murein DD-endopeptidase MepM/ murein hydrolase activator NlpD [Kiritimatiellia bacterium]
MATMAWGTDLCAEARQAKVAAATQGVLTTVFDSVLARCPSTGRSTPAPFRAPPARLGAILPVAGVLTSQFGWRAWPFDRTRRQHHDGVDIAAPAGTTVGAVDSGRVTYASLDGGHGLTVQVVHFDGVVTKYCHLSTIDVFVGQRIRRGAPLGAVGSTGVSTGPHLHYSVVVNDKAVDPITHPLYAPVIQSNTSTVQRGRRSP